MSYVSRGVSHTRKSTVLKIWASRLSHRHLHRPATTMPASRQVYVVLGLGLLVSTGTGFQSPLLLQIRRRSLGEVTGPTVATRAADDASTSAAAGPLAPEAPRSPKARRGTPLYWKIRAAGDRRDRPTIKRMLADHSRDAPTFRALRPGERDALIIAAARAGLAREASTLTRWTDANKNPPSVRTLEGGYGVEPSRGCPRNTLTPLPHPACILLGICLRRFAGPV